MWWLGGGKSDCVWDGDGVFFVFDEWMGGDFEYCDWG